jgi:energy-coupling factor transporter ATP-binding protein EcfA2
MVRQIGTKASKAMYNNRSKGDPRRKQTSDYRYHLSHDVLTQLHRGECCAVVGVGSCGKSRLLRHLARPETLEYHLGDAGYDHLFVLVECNSWTGESSWSAYEGIARAINEMVESVGHPVINNVRRELEPLYQAVVDDRDIASRHLRTALGILLDGSRINLTLCFDEFDFVFERFEAQLFRNLRAFRDSYKYKLTYMVATRKQLPYQRPADQWPEVEGFYELFSDNTFAIGPYDQKDANEMIVDLETRYEYKLRAQTRELLIEVTGGHPGLIGASFRHIEQVKAQPNNPREMAQLLTNEPTTWKECRKIWDPLRDEERTTLHRVASNNRLSREENAILQELKSKGLVREINNRGSIAIFSPIFQEFAKHADE